MTSNELETKPTSDASTPVSCGAGEKRCDNRCVLVSDPAFGCSPSECAPCPDDAPHGNYCDSDTCRRCDLPRADCSPAIPGCEINLQTDANHCGSCNHDCLGAPCRDGLCSPVLIHKGVEPIRIRLRDHDVYWSDTRQGTILRASMGEAPVAVVTEQPEVYGLAVDPNCVYWTVKSNVGRIRQRCKVGSGIDEIVKGTYYPTELYLASGFLYWLEGSTAGVVGRLNLDTRKHALIQEHVGEPHALGVTGENLYFSERVRIMHWTPNTKAPKALVDSILIGGALLVDDTHVYWSDLNAGTVSRVARNATERQTVLSLDWNVEVTSIVSDGKHLYLGVFSADPDTTSDGQIVRVEKNGDRPMVLVRGQQGVHDVAVDHQRIYWVNQVGGEVQWVAK